jgi:hypothetical protein
MREYVDWEEGRTRVRVHRRVLAGLEREPPGAVAGLVFGTVSPGEVLIEDYATGVEQADSPLEPVGYFRVIDGPEETAVEPGFGLLSVLLLFRRGDDRVTL